MLLNSSSPDAFLDRSMTLDLLAQRDNAKIADLKEAHEQAKRVGSNGAELSFAPLVRSVERLLS